MTFSILEFLAGFLLVGSVTHLVMAYSNLEFPSLFGRSPRANMIYSVCVAAIAVDLFIFSQGFSAFLSNGLLMGAVDMYLLYLLFGKLLHKKLAGKGVPSVAATSSM